MTHRAAKQRLTTDIAVVGAGAAGVLVATALGRLGFNVLLIEPAGFGARQSNHSHGYLHSGYIYPQPSQGLVSDLVRGSNRWRELLNEAGCRPVTSESTIAFANPANARRVAERWRSAGLNVRIGPIPDRFREPAVTTAFTTDEPTYDFTRWFEHALSELPESVQLIRGMVRQLDGDRNEVAGLDVWRSGDEIRVEAAFYVLTAGVKNLALIQQLTRIRGRSVNRTSHMFVVESDAPLQSVVVPDHEAHGLFIASRPSSSENRTAWLISDYISFAAGINSVASAALWVRGVARTVRRLTNILDTDDYVWGFYPAPKGELRPDPRVLSQHSVESYGLRNCLVASPSKLTLAPLLAEVVTSETKRRLGPTRKMSSRSPSSGDEMAVLPERWNDIQWRSASDLSRLIETDDVNLEEAIEVVGWVPA